MAKEQTEKIKVVFDADTDSVEDGLKKIVNLATTNSKKLARLGNVYTKKINFTHKEAQKLYGKLNKAAEKFAKVNVTGSKETWTLQHKLMGTYEKMRKIQEELNSVHDARNLGKTKLAELAKLKKETESLTAELNKQVDVSKQEGTYGYGDRLSEYIDLLKDATKKNADLIEDDKEREKYLEKQEKRIEEINDGYKKRLETAKEENKVQELNEKLESKKQALLKAKAAAVQKGARADIGERLSGFGMGALSKVSGVDFDPSDFAKKMKGLADVTKAAGGSVGKLSGVFDLLSVVASRLVTFLGGFAVAIVGAIIAADAYDKEIKSKLLAGVGATGLGGLNEATKGASGEAALKTFGPGGLRVKSEELQALENTLMKTDMTIQNLGGDVGEFNKATEQSAIIARNFGISMDDAAGLVGEYFQTYGAGADTIKKTFDIMTKSMKDSNMSSTSFLGIMKSVGAQMNVFIDQTQTFASVVGKLGKSGELTTKTMQQYVDAMAGFGKETLDDSIRFMALNKKSAKDIARIKMKELKQELKTTQMSAKERLEKQRQLAALDKVVKGGTLTGAAASRMGLGSMDRVVALLQTLGINSADQLDQASTDGGLLKKMAAMTGKSDDQMQDLLMGVRDTLDAQGKTGKLTTEEMLKVMEDAQKPDPDEAKNTAKQIASETVPMTAGLAEVGNALLYQLVKGLNAVLAVLKKMAKWVGGGADAAEENVGLAREQLRKNIATSKENAEKQVAAIQQGPDQAAPISEAMMKRHAVLQGTGAPGGAAATTAATGTMAKSIFDMYPPPPATVAGGVPTAATPAGKAAAAGAGPGTAAGGGSDVPPVNVNVYLGNKAINDHISKVTYDREKNATGAR